MATNREPENLNLRDTSAVVAYAQSIFARPDPEDSRPGLRPVVSVHPNVRGPDGSTAYQVSVSGEGFGGPASSVVLVDPNEDNPFTVQGHFRYQYALVLRKIQRRFMNPEESETATTPA